MNFVQEIAPIPVFKVKISFSDSGSLIIETNWPKLVMSKNLF